MTIDDDIEAAISALRRERGMGRSEALNALARRGLAAPPPRPAYRHRSVDLGLRIDVANVGDVLDLLDET